jgi:urea transporter/murein DD-endopeptidase MepM/ murein hydrolase activator NlpD
MKMQLSYFRTSLNYFLSSILNSYSQVFFSDHRGFAVLLMVVTFFDPWAGLAGLAAVLATSVVAFMMNFDRETIAKGLYGFNSLLVGLGLGVYFAMSWHLAFIIVLAAIFTLFISVSLQGVIGKYGLPFLSIPFLLVIWTFSLATNTFTALGVSERGIFTYNELFGLGGFALLNFYLTISEISIPELPRVFFISLSAIFFQYNVLAGILIAIGLLLFSRIAFTLAILGFVIAFGFYEMTGANVTALDYSYIGFNYILTSIALGGFFLIPSLRSYLGVLVMVPLVAILTISLNMIFINFRLPVYSLPFNLVTLLFLYVLKFRVGYSPKLSEVFFQFNAPEKNLYTFVNNQQRFRFHHLVQLKLPFYGVWSVSQGHDGEHTHKAGWRHAWDFVILDKDGKQFKNEGDFAEDYFCYNKPVLAPAQGVVEKVVSTVDDNPIGEVNLQENWGNTVIIKHADFAYTKLSHLKKDSIVVKEGDTVKTGQIIGKCGNSGRSPFPHLHFQVQATPHIGSETLDYLISHYVVYRDGQAEFANHSSPQLNELVSNVEANPLLAKAFNFIPGQKLQFRVQGHPAIEEVTWEIHVNPQNQPYIYCPLSDTVAYFESDGSLFYFSRYYGKKQGLLYQFFLGAYKIQKGFYKGLDITDYYPLHQCFPKRWLWVQDFISPFYIYARSRFRLVYKSLDDTFGAEKITLLSAAENIAGKKLLNRKEFEIEIGSCGINVFRIKSHSDTIILTRCENNYSD